VIAPVSGPGSAAYYATDARLGDRSRARDGRTAGIPIAYKLDDLTYAALWAMANLDQALLDDDAALAVARRRARAGAWARREVGREEAGDLTGVSQMWLGSRVCADHVTGHLDQIRDVPVFWTREQRGEEASTWLLFAHKLRYLQATTFPQTDEATRPARVFCIPETAVAASAPMERILLLLAVALMEAHGVRVHVITDPGYGQVPGFVCAPTGPSLIATWVRAEQVWHTAVTTRRDVAREFADAAGDAAASSVIAAGTSLHRLQRLAYYLGLDWRWLQERTTEMSAVGWGGLIRPRSRLLSVTGLDLASRYLATAA
jgi:hypothetical protein